MQAQEVVHRPGEGRGLVTCYVGAPLRPVIRRFGRAEVSLSADGPLTRVVGERGPVWEAFEGALLELLPAVIDDEVRLVGLAR